MREIENIINKRIGRRWEYEVIELIETYATNYGGTVNKYLVTVKIPKKRFSLKKCYGVGYRIQINYHVDEDGYIYHHTERFFY